jgi:hypothetical protein
MAVIFSRSWFYWRLLQRLQLQEVLVPIMEKGFKELGVSDDVTEWLKLRLK